MANSDDDNWQWPINKLGLAMVKNDSFPLLFNKRDLLLKWVNFVNRRIWDAYCKLEKKTSQGEGNDYFKILRITAK